MPAHFSLQNDQPYTGQADPLGFDAIAADLARLVLASRQSTPFTLGIEAAWGIGKSSLMQRLRDELGREDGIETVWFNAWTAKDQEALEGLVRSVLEKLDANVLRRTMRRKKLMSLGRVVVSVAGTWLGAGGLVDAFWERMSVDPRARNEARELLAQAMREWMAKGGTAHNRLLVVFVDDLDRCSPTNVFQVFEAIKLYLDAPGFVFVIGLILMSSPKRSLRSTTSRPVANISRRSSSSSTASRIRAAPGSARC